MSGAPDVQDHQYFLSYHVRLSRWLRRLHKQVSVNVQSLDRKFKFINVGVVMYAGFVTYFDHLILVAFGCFAYGSSGVGSSDSWAVVGSS